jgi:hypothetical protein
MKKNKAD